MSPPARLIAYDYAVIRVIPRVHLGRFDNVGVILHARREGFIDLLHRVDPHRIALLASTIDLALLERHLQAWRRIATGEGASGAIALLPPSERFHWLTSPRSTILQTSPVHPGRCADPSTAIMDLFQRFCGFDGDDEPLLHTD